MPGCPCGWLVVSRRGPRAGDAVWHVHGNVRVPASLIPVSGGRHWQAGHHRVLCSGCKGNWEVLGWDKPCPGHGLKHVRVVWKSKAGQTWALCAETAFCLGFFLLHVD